MHPFAHRGSAPSRPFAVRALLAAVFALLLGVPAASAAGPAPFAGGLHVATGSIVDPVGRTWVADHNGGFCRVTDPSGPALGSIEHPRLPGDGGPRTCLGGLLPNAAPGPDAAGAPALADPTPDLPRNGDLVALIPDGASPSNTVWRAHWNPATELFEDAEEIHMDADPTEPDRPRPTAVSVAADGTAYVVFQRSATIQMIEDPAGDRPVVHLVGSTADGRGAAGVAATYSPLGPLAAPVIVVAETTGLTEITGTAGSVARITTPAPYQLPVDPNTLALSTVSALAYRVTDDIAGKGVLYAGTADSLAPGDQVDRVLRFDTRGSAAAPAPAVVHASGFTMVGGLGVRPGTDRVMVVDEPALLIDGEPLGLGRMFEIGSPYARITDGPSNVAGRVTVDPRFTASPTPRFSFVGDTEAGARQQCSLTTADQPLTDASFAACTSPFSAPALATDGSYRFAVRTVEDSVPSRADVRLFTLDRLAPGSPQVANPGEGDVVSSNPYLQFAPPAGEEEQGYECDFGDGRGFVTCAEGRRVFGNGARTLKVRAVDGAGNVTPDAGVVVRRFTVGADTTPDTPVTTSSAPLAKPESWARYADGLHISTGAFEAPDGSLWVTDHNAGLCRVSAPTLSGAGRIVHPQLPSGTEERTCLGGLLPHAREGADAAGTPALVDPTPAKPGSGDEVVLVPDGATKQKTLWRAQWNKRTHRFDPLDAFDGPPADPAERGPRPTAAAVGPDGNVYYVTKTQDWIVRIRNAASAAPTASVVGYTSDGRGAESIAVGGTAAGPDGLRRGGDRRDAGAPVGHPAVGDQPRRLGLPRDRGHAARPGPGRNGDRLGGLRRRPPAPLRGHGQRRGRGRHRHGPRPALPARGTQAAPTFTRVGDAFGRFTTIGGLGLRPDGRLLVADDPAIVTPGEPLGLGRLTQVGSPAAHIAAGPSNLPGLTARVAGVTADSTPEFTLEGDTALRCWLRQADTPTTTAPSWAACGTTFVPSQALADGRWLLTVQSTVAPADANVAETLAFEVDSVDPQQPKVDAVAPVYGTPATTDAAPRFTFAPAAGDEGRIAGWTCRLNDQPAVACKPGRTFPLVDGTPQVADGENTLVIAAIDRAGRTSPASAAFGFRADAVLPSVAFSAPDAGHRQTSRTATFAFGAGEAGVTYGCRLDGAPFRRCDVTGGGGLPASSAQAGDGTVTLTYDGLTDGAHTLEVHATDEHGNLSGNVRRRLIVDNTAPAVAIAEPAQGSTTGPATTATFGEDTSVKGEGEPDATFECTLDGNRIGDCDGSVELTGLSSGTHSLTVVAVDDVGNRSTPVTRTWTADAGAPVTAFAAGPADGALVTDSPQIGFSADEGATFRCAFDGEALRECRSPVREGGLQAGAHTVLIEATDAFGNVSTVTRRFTIVPRGTVIPAPAPPVTPAVVPLTTTTTLGLNGLAAVRVATTVPATTVAQAGLPVTVRVTGAANVVRIRVFRVVRRGGARAAAARTTKKLVATVYKTTPDAGTYRFRIKDRRLHKLAAGRYVVEVRAGASKKRLGRATQRTFTVRARR